MTAPHRSHADPDQTDRTDRSCLPRGARELFPLGRLLITPAALDALAVTGELPTPYLWRHQTGDWGVLDAEDIAANEQAVLTGERILSAYALPTGLPLWIITEADRSVTTILLPSDY